MGTCTLVNATAVVATTIAIAAITITIAITIAMWDRQSRKGLVFLYLNP